MSRYTDLYSSRSMDKTEELDMAEAYIRFMAPVIPPTIDQLMKHIDWEIHEKCERIHLLISSPGGSGFQGSCHF